MPSLADAIELRRQIENALGGPSPVHLPCVVRPTRIQMLKSARSGQTAWGIRVSRESLITKMFELLKDFEPETIDHNANAWTTLDDLSLLEHFNDLLSQWILPELSTRRNHATATHEEWVKRNDAGESYQAIADKDNATKDAVAKACQRWRRGH